jgi:hypothetical protein
VDGEESKILILAGSAEAPSRHTWETVLNMAG